MRNHLIAVGLAAATLLPSAALAQQTCEQRAANRTVGTIAGAGLGALLGGAVAGHDDRTAGALIGAVGGAVAGNQLAKGQGDCSHAYGYYDTGGMWHASAVRGQQASGYYDRDGHWVNGAPNGYYSQQGRWVTGRGEASNAAYRDQNGRYVPASANGYYDADGRWVGGAASGHYAGGRWVSGPAVGRYDRDGRWISGQAAGHHDANGVWIADAQPGYYDNGRWVRGEARGYYDGGGRWLPTADVHDQQPDGHDSWTGARDDIKGRSAWVQDRVERGVRSGALTRQNGGVALGKLDLLRRDVQVLQDRDGNLNRRQREGLMARLDSIDNGLQWASAGPYRQN